MTAHNKYSYYQAAVIYGLLETGLETLELRISFGTLSEPAKLSNKKLRNTSLEFVGVPLNE